MKLMGEEIPRNFHKTEDKFHKTNTPTDLMKVLMQVIMSNKMVKIGGNLQWAKAISTSFTKTTISRWKIKINQVREHNLCNKPIIVSRSFSGSQGELRQATIMEGRLSM
jgi:hypothetical protein